MANDATKVALSKPKVGGAIYWAPAGTTLPTDTTTTLAAAFKCLGYVSDDGITKNIAPSTETVKAFGGDIVAVPFTGRAMEFGFALIEELNEDVQKVVNGSDNVSGALATGLTIRGNNADMPAGVWVIDLVINKTAKRTVIPNGKVTDIGEVTYKDDEVISYDMTITALPGDTNFNYDCYKEYMKTISSGTSA